MIDVTAQLWNALNSGATPIIVVYYHDLGTRRSVMDQVLSIAPPDWPVRETSSIDEALSQPDALVLLTPQDERRAIPTCQ